MKFIECMNGDIINLADVCKITYEQAENLRHYYSYLHLRDGSKVDFIEFADSVGTKHGEIKLEPNHFSILNKKALECALVDPLPFVENLRMENYAYHHLELEILIMKGKEVG